jgi:competence protein ComEC
VRDGDRLRLFASLSLPRGYGNPGAFDAEGAALHEGWVATGHCKTSQLVTHLGPATVSPVRLALARARAWSRQMLRTYVPAGGEEGLVRAMVLGDRSGLPPETAEAFRAAGTFHVLALSGAQVALVAGLLFAALRRAGAGPRATAAVVAAAVTAYAAFVGGDVPIVRAALMTVVVALGRALDFDADLGNLVGLAGGVLLIARPSSVFDVGFQLSFGATLGLVMLTGRIVAWLPRLPLRLDAALAGSLAAQVPLVPFVAAHFHRLTPAALLLNLLAIPLSTAVLLSGFAVLFLAKVPPLAEAAGQLAWWMAHALLHSADPVSALPGLAPRVVSPDLLAVLLYLAGTLLIFRKGRPLAGALVVAAALGSLVWPASARGDGRLRLTVLDVGQGDALVLRSPRGRVRMVDAGGTYDGGFDVGEAVVAPYLWSLGASALDGIVVTHAHPDHAGGVPALLRGFTVRSLWEGPAPRRDPGYATLAKALGASGADARGVVRGTHEEWDGVHVRVLGPGGRGGQPLRVRNDDSVVLEVGLGDVRFLLAGDVEAAGEAALRPRPAMALKVPHHGSRSSSSPAFVDAVAPRVALVSAGLRNRFGHPDPGVVARYRARGVLVLSTAVEGAITLSTDGRQVWLGTHRGGGPEVRLR